MRALLQRVSRAAVRVEDETVGEIGPGLLVLLCVMQGDTADDLDYIVRKTAGLRIFADDAGRFDRSVVDICGAILLVSQFTLSARTRKGKRPSFTDAAAPEEAERVCGQAVAAFRAQGLPVETGRFGATMAVELVNDGPVTIWLDSRDTGSSTGG